MGGCDKKERDKTEKTEIGRRIKQLREKRELRQCDVADALNIARSNYAKIESGERDLKSGHCVAIAQFFGVTCDYLLRDTEAQNIDFCARTGLKQKTIDALERYAACSQLGDITLSSTNGWTTLPDPAEFVPLREIVINAILTDENFLNEITRAAKMATHSADEDDFDRSFDFVSSASKYNAGIAFANFFDRRLTRNQEIVEVATASIKHIDIPPMLSEDDLKAMGKEFKEREDP